jgi:hypothetical protein
VRIAATSADAGDHLARDRGGEEFLLQLRGAEPGERRRGHVGLHADRHRHGAASAGAQRFGHHDRIAVVELGAADRGGLGEPEQAEVPQLAEDLMRRIDASFFPGLVVGVDLLAAEALDRAAQLLVFVRERHGQDSRRLKAAPRRS